MKNLMLLAAMLFIFSMTSCSNEGNDPMEQSEQISIELLSFYGARSLSSNDAYAQKLHLEDLPAISINEANEILSAIKKHNSSQKDYAYTCGTEENGMIDFCITMSETINKKYTFAIQMNMEKDSGNGTLYFKNYQAQCSADSFVWYIKGFSFASDNETGNNKFESPCYLCFKIINDGIQYIQVPMNIKGSYNPSTNQADFSYKL